MTVSRFLDYLRYEKRYSNHTLTAYAGDLGQFGKYMAAQYGVSDINVCDTFQVRSWMVEMVDSGLTSRSINRKVVTLRTYFRWCRREGLMDHNPADGLLPVKGGKKLPEYVDEKAMISLLELVYDPEDYSLMRNRVVINLLYHTGIRLSELITIRRDQVSGVIDQIKVTGKRNKERIIPVGRSMSRLLESYIELRDKEFGFEKGSMLFLTDKGKPLYSKFVYRLVNQSLEKVTTITRRSPHIIRHSFATAMLNHGADINAVKELLGHSSLASTEVYTHNSVEKLKKVYRQAHPRA